VSFAEYVLSPGFCINKRWGDDNLGIGLRSNCPKLHFLDLQEVTRWSPDTLTDNGHHGCEFDKDG
jgi:hypothetical protein